MQNFGEGKRNLDTNSKESVLRELEAQLAEAQKEKKRLPDSVGVRMNILRLKEAIERLKAKQNE